MKRSGIYKITCANGKFYYGQAKNIHRRFIHHRCGLNRGKHSNPYLQNLYDKYGLDFLKFEVLCYCDKEDLNYIEQTLLDEFIDHPDCLNVVRSAAGGGQGGMRGKTQSEETRSMISSALKGKAKPPRSAEHCKKISEAHKGRTFSDEHRQALSKAAYERNRKKNDNRLL